jgi:DNA-directed RNA polymerase subunit RPC12/RpoP
MKKSEQFRCPRCGGGIPNDIQRGQYPGAISRWDNKTEVCSSCGKDEALIQWYEARRDSSGDSDSHALVHPVHGKKPWVVIPDGIDQ